MSQAQEFSPPAPAPSRHQVLGLAFCCNGALLASASVDTTVRLWDASTGEHKCELAGHTDWVRAVAFAPPTGSRASETGDAAAARGARASDTGGAAVPVRVGRSALLASCGDDATIRTWDLTGAQPTLRCECGRVLR